MESTFAASEAGLELYLEELTAEPLDSSVAAACAATFFTASSFSTAGSTASSFSSSSCVSSATG